MMRKQNLTKERFLDDVKDHKVSVLLDDGVYRHLHCSKGSCNQHFDIVTYPGYLVVSGDMGSFVFSRVNDMFNFFRLDEWRSESWINLGYWDEKLQSVSRWGGLRKFDIDLVMQSIIDHVDDICNDIDDYWEDCNEQEDYEDIEHFEKEFRDEVEDHFKYRDMDEHRFISAVDDFESNVIDGLNFSDDYGWLCTDEYSYQYIWCCYAIVWSIIEYDKIKENA